jgi:Domain of unknown function (DUF4270)
MKKSISFYLFALFIAFTATLQTACNDSSSIGADLLEQDQLNIAIEDTFAIETFTVAEDSIALPSSESPFVSYPVGILQDPIFGESEASLYFEVSPFIIPADRFSPKKLAGAIIDSVVMTLQYDTVGYGDLKTPRSLDVFRLSNPINATIENIGKSNVFSTQNYAVFPTPIASKNNFIARNKPRVKNSAGKEIACDDCVGITAWYYNDTKKIDTSSVIKLDPHVRIPLAKTLAEEVFKMDSVTLNDNKLFREKIKGFFLKPTSKNAGMVNFSMTATNAANLLSSITVYYRDKDLRHRVYVMYADAGTVKVANYKHQFTNTIKSAYNNKTLGDSILYLQGMGGSNIKIGLPTLKYLNRKGYIVNKAELELYAKNTNDGFTVAPQLTLKRSNDGKFDVLNDVIYGSSNNYKAFGGKPTSVTLNGETVNKYTLNLSYQVQNMIDRTNGVDDVFFLSTTAKNQRPYRTIFYGAKHSKFRPKLKVYYTKVN